MEIGWSKFALADLEQIEDYIGNRFTYREYQNFMNILNHKIGLILDKKVTLIYKLESKYLKILQLYNNYQDENKKFVIDDL